MSSYNFAREQDKRLSFIRGRRMYVAEKAPVPNIAIHPLSFGSDTNYTEHRVTR